MAATKPTTLNIKKLHRLGNWLSTNNNETVSRSGCRLRGGSFCQFDGHVVLHTARMRCIVMS
eukprot:1066170-Amphidinium_carterae.1